MDEDVDETDTALGPQLTQGPISETDPQGVTQNWLFSLEFS